MSDLEAVISQLAQAHSDEAGVALGSDYESDAGASDDQQPDAEQGAPEQAETAEQGQDESLAAEQKQPVDYERAFKGLQGTTQKLTEQLRALEAQNQQTQAALQQALQQQQAQFTPQEQDYANRIQQAEWSLQAQRAGLTDMEVRVQEQAIANAKAELRLQIQNRQMAQQAQAVQQMSAQQRAQMNEVAKPLYMQRLIEQAAEVGVTLTRSDLDAYHTPDVMLEAAKAIVRERQRLGVTAKDQPRLQAAQDRQANGRFAPVRQGQVRTGLERLRQAEASHGLNSVDDIAASISTRRKIGAL